MLVKRQIQLWTAAFLTIILSGKTEPQIPTETATSRRLQPWQPPAAKLLMLSCYMAMLIKLYTNRKTQPKNS